MKQKDLAEALGLTPGQVSRLVKRGMPNDDIERALRWRRRHLELARTADHRADYRAQRVERTLEQTEMPAHLARLVMLADSASTALAAGALLPRQLEEALRQEMRAVPLAERADVCLPVSVWEALTRDVRSVLDSELEPVAPETRTSYESEASDPSPANRAWQGDFAYRVAAGEITVSAQPVLDLQ